MKKFGRVFESKCRERLKRESEMCRMKFGRVNESVFWVVWMNFKGIERGRSCHSHGLSGRQSGRQIGRLW